MPPKTKELKTRLRDAGFVEQTGKGSHTNWTHPKAKLLVTIAGRDGADARQYQIKQVSQAIEEVKP